MPLALLLSPDDQAVSAITAVLEEMSVTCERPLDGVSAAKQLNSHNFDLVLVDCENLPAAKLIFDVCRRGKNGKNPVPIAIVDGRAGLPTAFRLGAELILTKPVAKDQARTTIRAAVNRVKKEQPAGQAAESTSGEAAQAEAANASQGAAETFGSQNEASPVSATQLPAETLALATAASSQGNSVCEPAIMAATGAAGPTMSAAATDTKEPEVGSGARAANFLDEPKAAGRPKPSDDPVLAEIELAESQPGANSPATVLSTYAENQGKQRKTRGPLLAVVALALICCGLYAAWMTQPAFRTLAQPQVDRVMALAGARPAQTRVPGPTPVKPAAQPTTAAKPTPLNTGEPGQTTPLTATDSAATAAVPGSKTTPATVAGNPVNKTDSAKTVAGQSGVGQKTVDSKIAAKAASAEAELLADKDAVVLSSKGAEKRLIHSVAPSYPASAHTMAAEATVVLKAVIDENGKVTGAQVVEGNAALADSAVSAVKQWRYRPYVREGKSVPFQTIVLVDFSRP